MNEYLQHRISNKTKYGVNHPHELNSYNRVKIQGISCKIVERDLGEDFIIPNNSLFKIKNHGLNHYQIFYGENKTRLYNLMDFHRLGFEILDISDLIKETFKHHFEE
jgi:hypothetical protein